MPALEDVVRKLCLHLPQAEERVSHGSPEFCVGGKAFATYTVNHHGDGRLALILSADRETQALMVASDPDVFFVPPYTGSRGWYGIELSRGLPFTRVAELAADAYKRVAPAPLARAAKPLAKVPKPTTVDIRKIDPFFFSKNQKLLAKLRALCLALPETSEAESFGMPVFKAGKKTFCQFACRGGDAHGLFWVGAEGQAGLTGDDRFHVPPYMGRNGWISLNLATGFDPDEVRSLLLTSYRHFALKRMLKALDG